MAASASNNDISNLLSDEVYDYGITKIDEDDIAEYGRTYCDEQWEKFKTFKGLLKNMALFIKGKLPDTPSHSGALLDRDPEYIARLLQLNSMNILTNDGQEWTQTITKDSVYMQREYVEFAYKPASTKVLNNIITALNNANLYYYAVSYNDCKVYQKPGIGKIDFSNPEFWLTRTLIKAKGEYENHTHVAEPRDMFSDYIQYYHYAKNFFPGTVFFMVWSKNWDEPDGYLMDEVIKSFS